MNKAKVKAPTADEAAAYVHKGIHEIGGLPEAWGGLIHKTLPAVLGGWSSVTLASVLAMLVRLLFVVAAALFPILVRKVVLASPQTTSAIAPTTLQDGLIVLFNAVQSATSIDVILGVIAVLLIGAPKLLDMFGKQTKVEHHTPFKNLYAAIQSLPIKDKVNSLDTEKSIRLTLLALREEMTLLIGAASRHDVTDVTLLEFCDVAGSKMKVRTRTANHDEVNRPVVSSKFVAYYVALEGSNFAEHDFTNSRNPFPPKRVSVRGVHPVDYRSVLYLPILCSEKVLTPAQKAQPDQIIDSCVGVICVHSSKAYRFWRWGDHTKGTGGFADVAFSRSMPYIALIEQLLSRTACKVKLEVK